MLNCRETREAVDGTSMRSGLGMDAEQHLQSCSDCRQYATGTLQLMGLLAAQPRVEVPADFDFHLRARIARARDEQHDWKWALAQFWSNSFSWKEASGAAVVLAAITMSATFYITRDTRAPQRGARIIVSPTPGTIAGVESTPQVVAEGRPAPPQYLRPSSRATNAPMTAARTVATVERLVPREGGIIEMSGAQEILIYQPGRAGRPGGSRSVVIPRRGQVAFGAQLATMRDVGSRPAGQSAVETF